MSVTDAKECAAALVAITANSRNFCLEPWRGVPARQIFRVVTVCAHSTNQKYGMFELSLQETPAVTESQCVVLPVDESAQYGTRWSAGAGRFVLIH